MVPYKELGTDAPGGRRLQGPRLDWVAAFIYAGALVAILNTVLILMLGQSRVGFAMARDRLLPRGLAATHPKYGTPHRVTLVTVGFVAVLAGFVPLSELAELVSIGTLFAFGLVAVGVMALRYSDPERERPFRTPALPVVAVLAIAGVIYLAQELPGSTWLRFLIWMALGLVVYFAYSRRASQVGAARRAPTGSGAPSRGAPSRGVGDAGIRVMKCMPIGPASGRAISRGRASASGRRRSARTPGSTRARARAVVDDVEDARREALDRQDGRRGGVVDVDERREAAAVADDGHPPPAHVVVELPALVEVRARAVEVAVAQDHPAVGDRAVLERGDHRQREVPRRRRAVGPDRVVLGRAAAGPPADTRRRSTGRRAWRRPRGDVEQVR
jgi:hypothetical protein